MSRMATDKMPTAFNAMLPYYGGKRIAAPKIVEALGEHRAYWEPFCGSLAVLFAKAPVAHETVCDLNGDVVNLALCLQEHDSAFEIYDYLVRTLHAEPVYEGYRAQIQAEPCGTMPDVERATAYVIASWQGINGLTGCANKWVSFAMRYSAGGGHQGQRWHRVVDQIPAWHERLRGVTILCRDAFDVLAGIRDEVGTVIYCDPPYFASSRGSSEAYLFDFREDAFHDDHSRLAELLGRFRRARVVVSYYDCPEVRRLYADWTIRPLATRKNLANTGKAKPRLGRGNDELLITNGESQVRRTKDEG